MRLLTRLNSVYNLMLRASTLVFRFVIVFYITKMLGLEASGVYGLAAGAIGIVPSLNGWGLNYFVARDVVGQKPAFTAARIKTRLLVTTVSLTAGTLICLAAALAMGVNITPIALLIVALVWLETYGLDIHIPLIAMEMPLQANVLVFVRSALWVPFAIAAGLVFPSLRNLETVLMAWIVSYALAGAMLGYFLRDWPLRQAAAAPVQFDWIRERLRRSWLIYISDLSVVGLMYLDRYIVSFMLGLTATGIYTFFWGLANALYTLMTTAVIQLALPILFKAYSKGSMAEWRGAMRQQMVKTVVLAGGMAVAILIASEILIHVMSMPQLAGHRDLLVLLLASAVIRSCSDLLNTGLTSIKKDNHYAMINMIGVCLSVAVAALMIFIFGLVGTGIAAVVTSAVVAALRAYYVLLFTRNSEGTQPVG